jgi:drug/metabolite transporter (DMT)-like permease
MPYAGEAAALSTAVLWAFTSLFFSEAARRVGGFHVNKLRLLFAACIYGGVFLVRTGSPLPAGLATDTILWLCLSSLIGIVIGDSLLFEAFTTIGPRLTTLIYATSPIMATVVAWVFLDEKLGAVDLLGIAITLGGIAWVVAERRGNGQPGDAPHSHPPHFARGILFALGGSLGQAVGLVTSKQAMLHTGAVVTPFEAAYVRILFGAATFLVIGLVSGQIPETLRVTRHRSAMLLTLGGTVVGPFFGIWMSLVAVSLIEAGVAATLNSMVPVFVIPLVIIFKKERVSPRAIIGSMLAVGGVALLFLN